MKNKKLGFSFVELLVTLVFIFLVLGALTPTITKRHKQPPKPVFHGTYICYRDYNNKLHEILIKGSQVKSDGKDIVGKCKFDPPGKAGFFYVQVLGGGGGGANNLTDFESDGKPKDEEEYIISSEDAVGGYIINGVVGHNDLGYNPGSDGRSHYYDPIGNSGWSLYSGLCKEKDDGKTFCETPYGSAKVVNWSKIDKELLGKKLEEHPIELYLERFATEGAYSDLGDYSGSTRKGVDSKKGIDPTNPGRCESYQTKAWYDSYRNSVSGTSCSENEWELKPDGSKNYSKPTKYICYRKPKPENSRNCDTHNSSSSMKPGESGWGFTGIDDEHDLCINKIVGTSGTFSQHFRFVPGLTITARNTNQCYDPDGATGSDSYGIVYKKNLKTGEEVKCGYSSGNKTSRPNSCYKAVDGSGYKFTIDGSDELQEIQMYGGSGAMQAASYTMGWLPSSTTPGEIYISSDCMDEASYKSFGTINATCKIKDKSGNVKDCQGKGSAAYDASYFNLDQNVYTQHQKLQFGYGGDPGILKTLIKKTLDDVKRDSVGDIIINPGRGGTPGQNGEKSCFGSICSDGGKGSDKTNYFDMELDPRHFKSKEIVTNAKAEGRVGKGTTMQQFIKYILSYTVRTTKIDKIIGYLGKGGDGYYKETKCAYTYNFKPLDIYAQTIHNKNGDRLTTLPTPILHLTASEHGDNHKPEKLKEKCNGTYTWQNIEKHAESGQHEAKGYWKNTMKIHKFEGDEAYNAHGGPGAIVISW